MLTPVVRPLSQDAVQCTAQSATPVEQLVGSGSGGAGAGILTKAGGLIGAGVKRSPDAHLAELLLPRAAFVQCDATEMCLSLQGAPFCYDVATGDFHDGQGTVGNAVSGDYTLADGRRGNLYAGPHPTPTNAGPAAATTTDGDGAASRTGTPGAGTGLGTGARTGAGTGGGRRGSATQTSTTATPSATGNGAAEAAVAGGWPAMFAGVPAVLAAVLL